MTEPGLSASPPSVPALPRWVRAADLVSCLLVVVATIIAVTGGSRLRLGAWRVSLTSPVRLLLWAFAISVVRYVMRPQLPIYRWLPREIWVRVRSAPSRAAFLAVIGTRPAIFFVGVFAVLTLGYGPRSVPNREFENEFLNLASRWDASWYLDIAMHGYSYVKTAASDVQQNIVFFPALPMTTRVLASPLGTAHGVYMLVGTCVSLVAFFCGLVYLYAFAREELTEDQSSAALWLLSAYPFALFYGAIYTESLFLLGAVGAFYHFRRSEFGRAGAWGLLVGLTRPNGCFLAVPLAFLAISPWLPQGIVGGKRKPEPGPEPARPLPSGGSLVRALTAAAMPGVGMLVYSVFIWQLTGRPFTWAEGHAAWGRHYQGLTSLVTDRYDYIRSAGLYGYVAQLPGDVLNALGALFALATAWPVARRLGLAYAIFILINIIPPLATGGLLSAGRLSSVLFPAFIWMAGAVAVRHRAGWLVTFMAIQALNAALFYTWRPLY